MAIRLITPAVGQIWTDDRRTNYFRVVASDLRSIHLRPCHPRTGELKEGTRKRFAKRAEFSNGTGGYLYSGVYVGMTE